MDQKISLAIFDFDGTLTQGHLWTGVAKHHRTHKVNRFLLCSYLMLHLPVYAAAKVRLYSEEKNRCKWGEDLSILFKGFSREEICKAFEWILDNYFMARMRQDIVAILKEHKSRGDTTVILSGMFTELLDIVAKKLDADYAVGTQLEIRDNIYTGRIIPPLCFGENKARLLKKFIDQKNLAVDLARSTSYADSRYDLPVFSLVGHPVAIYPDKQLFQIAADREWRIIGSVSSMIHHS